MPYGTRPGLPKWSLLILTPLVFALSACATAGPTTLFAPSCFTEMVQGSGLDKATPHAALPADAAVTSWADFGNREGGQLDKSNADKAAIVGIGQTCDRWATDAKAKFEKKPWYRRIFG